MKELIELAESRGYKPYFDWSMKQIPTQKMYGYIESNSFEEESGWILEEGEERYYEDLEKYNNIVYIELCLIQKWLMDDKKVYALPDTHSYIDHFGFLLLYGMHKEKTFASTNHKTYEEALKEGIKKALELIK